MNWGEWFLAAIGVQYILAGAGYWYAGNRGYSLALVCYGISSFGLLWAGAK